ncbi:MAG: hypothetical protein DRP58_10065 [Spirochaetes bacterium]|nr:MAG: hypothetical protein DRP58_10065 [Spirochaetota bacterium]
MIIDYLNTLNSVENTVADIRQMLDSEEYSQEPVLKLFELSRELLIMDGVLDDDQIEIIVSNMHTDVSSPFGNKGGNDE